MSKWRKLQKELKQEALHGEKLGIAEIDISYGRLKGTTYFKRGTKPSKGILLVHGISGNRYGLGVLAQRLAAYGYFCLSIDLPSHFLNVRKFSVGEISESVEEAVSLLKGKYGMRTVGVVGHSIGAVGSLLSTGGYNTQIEGELYHLWEQFAHTLEEHAKLAKQKVNPSKLRKHAQQLEKIYTDMKLLILMSIKNGIQRNANVAAYVFLAPPRVTKAAVPGMSILRRIPTRWAKFVLETIFHKPAVQQAYKEGNPVQLTESKDSSVASWQFLRTKNLKEFLDYYVTMKEPSDFLSLIEKLGEFRDEEKTSFFNYYLKKYIYNKPKLFIYGSKDFFLRPFMPFEKRKLENFYKSCGNAKVIRGKFSHIIMNNPNQQMGAVAVKNDKVTEDIINFLSKHV